MGEADEAMVNLGTPLYGVASMSYQLCWAHEPDFATDFVAPYKFAIDNGAVLNGPVAPALRSPPEKAG